MGDVGERAGVHERRGLLQGLHQVGHQRVAHQDGHGAAHAEIVRGEGLAALVGGQHDAPQPLAEVLDAGGQGQDGHHLGGHRDVVPGLARGAVPRATQADDDLAQCGVLDVHDAVPEDGERVDVQAAQVDAREGAVGEPPLVEHAPVDGRRGQVVRHAHGVNVAGEVQVKVLHRHDLRVPAAGRAALDAKGGAHGGLADAGEHPVAELGAQRLGEAHGGGRLALAEGRGGDRRDVDIAGAGPLGEAVADVQVHLGLVPAVWLQVLFPEADAVGDVEDRAQRGCLGDFEVALHGRSPLLRRMDHHSAQANAAPPVSWPPRGCWPSASRWSWGPCRRAPASRNRPLPWPPRCPRRRSGRRPPRSRQSPPPRRPA